MNSTLTTFNGLIAADKVPGTLRAAFEQVSEGVQNDLMIFLDRCAIGRDVNADEVNAWTCNGSNPGAALSESFAISMFTELCNEGMFRATLAECTNDETAALRELIAAATQHAR